MVNISNDGNQYSLQNFLDGKVTERHITDLKVFYYDPDNIQNMSLSDIALRDRIHEFPVETVIEHYIAEIPEGQRMKSSDLSFKIKWQGFNDKWNTIEPFTNVRLNGKVHEYMRTHQLKRFIPRNSEGEPDRVNRMVTFSLPEGEGEEEPFVTTTEGKRETSSRRTATFSSADVNSEKQLPPWREKEGRWRKRSIHEPRDKKDLRIWVPVDFVYIPE